MLRRLDGFLAAALVAGLVALAAWLGRPETMAGAVRVIDGDTIEMAGRRIRLLGLDAPELAQACGDPANPVACGARDLAGGGLDRIRRIADHLDQGTESWIEDAGGDRARGRGGGCIAGAEDVP